MVTGKPHESGIALKRLDERKMIWGKHAINFLDVG